MTMHIEYVNIINKIKNADTEAISDRPDGVEVLLKPFTPNKLETALARACSEPVDAAQPD